MRIIGRGRYAGETYPVGPGGGSGGGAANVPLSRQRFIDGDTDQLGLTGAAAQPFQFISQFMSARAPAVSIADATANFVGWLMPSLAGYTENVAFPPYASTELRADSISAISGTVITGNMTWANSSGPFAASLASVALHNILVTGSFTVTDDVGAPVSNVILSGDEVGRGSGVLGGGFVSSAATRLAALTLTNFSVSGNINAGTSDNSAAVTLLNSQVAGEILARTLSCIDSTLNVDAITVNSSGTATFLNVTFTPGSAPVLTASGGALFDGLSWQSFMRAEGTRSATTAALVVGGYNGAAVEGALLTGAATSVSLNGAGATVGFTGSNSGNHYSTTSATPTSVTLLTGGALPGDTLLISKRGLGANAIAIINGGDGAGTIGTIPASSRGFVLAQFDGTNWAFAEGGALAA